MAFSAFSELAKLTSPLSRSDLFMQPGAAGRPDETNAHLLAVLCYRIGRIQPWSVVERGSLPENLTSVREQASSATRQQFL